MAEDLIACCRALPRCYHRPCQEKFLQPEHMLSRRVVRDRIDFPRQNLGLVRHPRVVPLVQRVRVVASDSLHCVCVCVCVLEREREEERARQPLAVPLVQRACVEASSGLQCVCVCVGEREGERESE